MPSYEQALTSAQARAIIEGVQAALSLEWGADTPYISAVTVVFDAEGDEGGRTSGLLSFAGQGQELSEDRTHAMLQAAGSVLAARRLAAWGHALEGEDDEG